MQIEKSQTSNALLNRDLCGGLSFFLDFQISMIKAVPTYSTNVGTSFLLLLKDCLYNSAYSGSGTSKGGYTNYNLVHQNAELGE